MRRTGPCIYQHHKNDFLWLLPTITKGNHKCLTHLVQSCAVPVNCRSTENGTTLQCCSSTHQSYRRPEYLPPPQLLQMSATETLLAMLVIREEQRKVSPKLANKPESSEVVKRMIVSLSGDGSLPPDTLEHLTPELLTIG
ncbi:uncharacterized protein LOC135334052 [Halichondria panicea]|uniref:uncharacterized protein LOC135334052 n=1 Tax=Halichondria panicea TaxID=6063 RepID=UPI00312B5F94